uniref:coiled-coil domain-containing protein 33 isoform X4 n=1 Tax=Ciona intestinalis TaxID=7719 RepID=UPI000EF47BF3|nr:coiled-coil domain-containing protein 33 isoform X4 [Ciona intestinalis]|eukprot:XP_026689989.1 coiled-coil domain-containing protein 33 isoform X4 [Ciona intestinalis]
MSRQQKKPQVKLEEKQLVFQFGITQAQFNRNGSFLLVLTIKNAHRQDLIPQVLLEVNNNGSEVYEHSISTDTVKWSMESQAVTFNTNMFKFTLPTGFCKNDKNYDVHLLIEAYALSGKRKERVGEALFAIYPRTEMPRANLHVKKGEDFYRYSGIITLLRPLSRSSISMHCGRLSYTVALKEFLYSETGYVDSEEEEDTIVEEPKTEEIAPQPILPQQVATIHEITKINGLSKHLEAPAETKPREIIEKPQTKNVQTQTLEYKPEPGNLVPTSLKSSKETTFVLSKDSLHSEDSFHISMSPTPSPDYHLPSNKQKTMDTPLQEDSRRQSMHSKNTRNGRTSRTTLKSPTMTSPLPPGTKGPVSRHVAKPGHEEVYVIMHGATSLPSRSDGIDPLPFATLKSLYEEKGGRPAQCATHATLQPTHSPTWEEVMTMQVPEDRVEEEELIVTISDSESKEKLVTYRLPIINLVPFHPYHFELVQPTKSIPAGIRLYMTVQRKMGYLPRLEGFGFCGLEVTLQDFQRELKNPAGPLLAVGRIVPDYTKYKDNMLSRNPCIAGITTSTITFPSPNPASFQVLKEHQQGFPQLTTPSKGSNKPEWNHSFMFCSNDTATMFSHNSALVIEFYPASTTMSSVTWTIRNPIGFATLLLDEDVFQALTSDAGRLGVRVDDLIVQGSPFATLEGPYPSVRLMLRLINSERPDTLAVPSNSSVLPVLDAMPGAHVGYRPNDVETEYLGLGRSQNKDVDLLEVSDPTSGLGGRDDTALGGPPMERKKTRLLVKDDEFPPKDVLQNILPDYVLTENDPDLSTTSPKHTMTHPSHATNQRMAKSLDTHTQSLLDHQAKELMKYREAVKRMSNDMISLRQTNAQLQDDNAALRRELMLTKEVGHDVMNDINNGVISSNEVADKFVAVRHKLAKETDDLKSYKAKVQHLQNQMIKANEREKQYLTKMPSPKELQNNTQQLQDKQRKLKKLEATCQQQEKVIQKMEKLLNKYIKQTSTKGNMGDFPNNVGDANNQGTVGILSQENGKLQIEVDQLRMQLEHHNEEKSDLLSRLERAESRVSSLESQLDHNSRTWAKERHELTVRLQEHRNGILRTTGGNLSDPLN